MRITVTAEDIAAGVPCSHDRCPIALALLRQTGECWLVDNYSVERADGGRAHLPMKAYYWTLRFDRGQPVEPFEFETQA